MRSLALIAVATSACAMVSFEQAAQQATVTNQRARDDAAARAHRDGEPFTPYAAPMAPIDGTPPLRSTGIALPGMIEGEGVLIMPDDTLALATVDCVLPSACGCDVATEYRFVRRPDRKVAVIRLRPTVRLREVRVASCVEGCGQQPPPIEPTARALGVRRAEDLELIDASYPYEHVRETCENPIVRP